MKIIHILNNFLPQHTAGTEVYVWSLCKHLREMDCRVSILIPNYESAVSEKYFYDDIEVFMYAEPSKPDRALKTGQKTSRGMFFFRQYLQEQRPDIVHFHGIAGSNGISVHHLETAKALGFKVIYTIHLAGATCNTGTLIYQQKVLCNGSIDILKCSFCSLQKRTNNRFYPLGALAISLPLYAIGINTLKLNIAPGTFLSYPFQIKNLRDKLKRTEAACDIIIPITNWYKKILLKNGISENKLKVVLQGLATNTNELGKVTTLSQLPLRLVFVGRIDPIKGIHLLIAAMSQFTAAELLLDIYGTTDDDIFLSTCKRESIHQENIKWKGVLPQSEIMKLLSQYDALILPSTVSEMSPLVIQEGFAAGLPVIGSDVYGIVEQVDHGVDGLLFRRDSKESLIAVLEQIVASPQILTEFSGNVKTPRSFVDVAQETFNIYQSVLSTQPLH